MLWLMGVFFYILYERGDYMKTILSADEMKKCEIDALFIIFDLLLTGRG